MIQVLNKEGQIKNNTPVTLTGVANYIHNQAIAASIWTVNHNLGYKPGGILIMDSANELWEANSVTYVDDNTLILDFNGLVFGGKAYLS